MYGLAASTGAAIVLDGQVQEKIAIGDYSGAADQATYHLPGLGSSRSLVEALSEGNILGAVLSFGSLGVEVLPFIKMLGPGVGKGPQVTRIVTCFSEHASHQAITRGFRTPDILEILREGKAITATGRYGPQIRYILGDNTVVINTKGKIITLFSNVPGTKKGLGKGAFIPFDIVE